MVVTPQNVRDLSLTKEFCDVTDPQIQERIDCAEKFVGPSVWGDCTDLAVKLLSAHFLLMDMDGGATPGGQLRSEAGAGLSHSFHRMDIRTADQLFATTSYGRKFISLRDTLPIGPSAADTTGAAACV